MDDFTLHPRLVTETTFVVDWTLSRVQLMNDSRFPWLILVPRRTRLIELFDLAMPDRELLMAEVMLAAKSLKDISGATKINVAALGNQVPQLHVHVVARHPGDPAWPGPVWGHNPAVPYQPAVRDSLIATVRNFR